MLPPSTVTSARGRPPASALLTLVRHWLFEHIHDFSFVLQTFRASNWMSHQQLDALKWSPSLFAVFCQLASTGCFFPPLFVALVSHCNVRIDSRTRVQLPPGFMGDFGYVAAEILRSQGATHPTTGPLISWVLRGFNREREWRRGASI